MSRIDSVISEQLTATFLRGLLSTPAGRAHLLNQAADAESSDENAIFERVGQRDSRSNHLGERIEPRKVLAFDEFRIFILGDGESKLREIDRFVRVVGHRRQCVVEFHVRIVARKIETRTQEIANRYTVGGRIYRP